MNDRLQSVLWCVDQILKMGNVLIWRKLWILVLILVGGSQVFFGVYLVFTYRRIWRVVLYGIGDTLTGLGLFLWGLNIIFAHMFFNVGAR